MGKVFRSRCSIVYCTRNSGHINSQETSLRIWQLMWFARALAELLQ
jgi:hypothetical protein